MDLQQIFDNTDFVHASGTKEEWIVLTAHYDTTSLSHGAYDNMSGCAGLLWDHGVHERQRAQLWSSGC